MSKLSNIVKGDNLLIWRSIESNGTFAIEEIEATVIRLIGDTDGGEAREYFCDSSLWFEVLRSDNGESVAIVDSDILCNLTELRNSVTDLEEM